ncbi:glyoxalase family protein [Podospora didyma]|uniref:Glyoxalase family protein n=1 Tax=Podospora didyma TaxID=330526 RepID=A0AAE0K2R2_9PEZI|nr:glyoxalase family protein [Podospora didyma]
MPASVSPTLDHIVLLLPPQVLTNVPSWLTDSFTIINGGQHAGGVTENKLIIFEDGSYIELIAFVEGVDPDKRAATRWGKRREGEIVDWALTLLPRGSEHSEPEPLPETFFPAIRDRINSIQTDFTYADLVGGGRTTPDGIELRWAIAAPVELTQQDSESRHLVEGKLPFWCLDRTPRYLRVPHIRSDAITRHPCGATGVARLSVSVHRHSEQVKKLSKVYDAILDQEADYVVVEPLVSGFHWALQVPVPQASATETQLVLREFTEKDLSEKALAEASGNSSDHARVDIALFVRGAGSKTLSGEVGDGRTLDIELIGVA